MSQLKPNFLSAAKKRTYLLLLLILLAGFALRLYRLGAESLWYDETVSAFLASESVPDLIGHTARDIHPPGYYFLLHFWTLVAGPSEFALAYLSLSFGVLLIPLTYLLSRRLADTSTAMWAALLVAFSPYHVWYAQEVRMYTLGAVLGLITAYCGLRIVASNLNAPGAMGFRPFVFTQGKSGSHLLPWLGYIVSTALGLYTLYYFAFLLIALNAVFLLYTLHPNLNRGALRSLVLANGLVVLVYLPWLPIAWRQATEPPVSPWRTFEGFTPRSVMTESWSALSLGQSVEPAAVWPLLLLTLALFILGLLYLNHLANLLTLQPPNLPFSRSPALFLLTYTFGPLLLIYLISFITPLYHVRYLFTYSPAFYIILGAGFAWLIERRWVWLAITAAGLFLAACVFSLYEYHFDPRYRADDYRAAVAFIQRHWQPGDVLMVNAGYVYPAFLYYTDLINLQRQRLVPYQPPADTSQPLLLQTGSVDGSPQLGWGDPRSDFYAMSAEETVAALEAAAQDFSRLWLLRAYDTVTDPTGLIRAWLAEHTIPVEDEPFSGESNIRAQGFLLPGATSFPEVHNFQEANRVEFEDGLALAGWSMPEQTWRPGQTIHLKLWWLATRPPSVDYKMSLKLWTATAQLAAQGQDTWPVGRLYRATTWPIGQPVYQADQLILPPDLPPGQYWLNVELYHPETGQPLPRLDGDDPVVTLGTVVIGD
jgi:uncharacterized membrane protein